MFYLHRESVFSVQMHHEFVMHETDRTVTFLYWKGSIFRIISLQVKMTHFWLLGGSATSCKYNTDVLSSYLIQLRRRTLLQAIASLHIQETWSNINIHLELCLRSPDKSKSNIHSLFQLCFSLHQHQDANQALQISLGYKCCGVWRQFMLHTCPYTNK